MRTWMLPMMIVGLTAACGKKQAPEAAVPDTSAATAEAAPPPEPEEPVEPAAPEPPANNADFRISLTRADGSVASGHVVRLERGIDWYAEDGWTDSASDLRVGLESSSDMKDVTWDQIAQIDITYGGRDQIDCQYDSAFSPWMYMCVLRSTPKAKLKDGTTWSVTSRHRWKMTFDDGNTVEFYVHKLPAREQDENVAGMDSAENYELYSKLQGEVMQQAKTSAAKKITITP